MIIDFTQVLKDFDGESIKGKAITEEKDGKTVIASFEDATLGFICVDVLLGEEQGEKVPADDKVKRFELARAIHKAESIDLESEDITLLKSRIAKFHKPLIVGITLEMLENKNVGTDDTADNAEADDESS